MKTIVDNCPRCSAKKITFDLKHLHKIRKDYGWQDVYEGFSVCRSCNKATIIVIKNKVDTDWQNIQRHFMEHKGDITTLMECSGYIGLKDREPIQAAEYLPGEIHNAFSEGARCVSVDCWNAAGTMFRMALDLATRPLLPAEGTPGINRRQRRDLGMRLPWLFDNGRLPEALRDLSSCIHQDGNDGAHQGTLKKADAEDLLEFTDALLTRLYTEPEKLRIAAARRAARRAGEEA